MARNRALSNFLGILIGIAALVGTFLILNFTNIDVSSDYGPLSVWGVGSIIAAFLLGFFAYKRDGIKITLIVSILVIIGGIVLGILMITVGDEIVGAMGEDNILAIFIGPAFLAMFLVLGIVLIVGTIIGSGVLIGVSAIGSAIGEAVWKDSKAELQAGAAQAYQPVQQPVYQPIEPTPIQQPKAVVCANCGVSNTGTENFCTNCGAKIR